MAASEDGPDTLATFTRSGVAHIRFERPHRLNAMTPLQHRRVLAALAAAAADPDVHAIAFSGAGRAFSAGDDISGRDREWPDDRRERLTSTSAGHGPVLLQEVTTAIRDLGKPTVAVLHGYAIGAGYDYATSCDFRVATDECRIGDQRVLRALWAGEGWTYKTPRLLGLTRAVELGLLGRMITGTQAYELGFVHDLIDDTAEPLASAEAFLTRVAALPADAYRVQKARLHALLDLPAVAAGLGTR